MKTSYILVFTMTLLACSKDDHTVTLNGKWKLIKYHYLTVGTSESEPTNISRSIIIDFSDNGGKGKMKGNTVTNSVSGDYELFNDNQMKTLSFGGTKVGEPDWGSRFWDAIHTARSFEREGNKMFIYFNSGTGKMEFKKQ